MTRKRLIPLLTCLLAMALLVKSDGRAQQFPNHPFQPSPQMQPGQGMHPYGLRMHPANLHWNQPRNLHLGPRPVNGVPFPMFGPQYGMPMPGPMMFPGYPQYGMPMPGPMMFPGYSPSPMLLSQGPVVNPGMVPGFFPGTGMMSPAMMPYGMNASPWSTPWNMNPYAFNPVMQGMGGGQGPLPMVPAMQAWPNQAMAAPPPNNPALQVGGMAGAAEKNDAFGGMGMMGGGMGMVGGGMGMFGGSHSGPLGSRY